MDNNIKNTISNLMMTKSIAKLHCEIEAINSILVRNNICTSSDIQNTINEFMSTLEINDFCNMVDNEIEKYKHIYSNTDKEDKENGEEK